MLNLLFPKLCNGCKALLSSYETVLCTHCRHNLPLICHHRNHNDAMKKMLYGRVPIANATALLQFQKRGITQEILHNLKYRKQEEISFFFGKWLGAELAESPNYKQIDMVIPVPLHKKKQKKRGYNQVAGFGLEIAKALNIPYHDDILLKKTNTNSQVFKKRLTRFGANEVFELNSPVAIENAHILLVDDIVTTGATLESCATQLLKAKNVTISLATIAITL